MMKIINPYILLSRTKKLQGLVSFYPILPGFKSEVNQVSSKETSYFTFPFCNTPNDSMYLKEPGSHVSNMVSVG